MVGDAHPASDDGFLKGHVGRGQDVVGVAVDVHVVGKGGAVSDLYAPDIVQEHVAVDHHVVPQLQVVPHGKLHVLEELGVFPHPLEDEGGKGPANGHPRVHGLADGGEVQDLPEPEEGFDLLELLLVGGGVVLRFKGDALGV
nr:hypothetical protein [Thermus scotoductus]